MFSDGRESWRARPLRHSCRGRDGQDADNKSALLAAPAGTTPDLVFSRRILLVSDRAPRTEPSRIDRRRRKEASATIGHELAPRSVAQDKAVADRPTQEEGSVGDDWPRAGAPFGRPGQSPSERVQAKAGGPWERQAVGSGTD